MQLLNKILTVVVIGAWLVPALANAAVSAAAVLSAAPVAAVSAEPVIIVRAAIPTATIAVTAPAAVRLPCSTTDDQATLLNQPADCFSLAPGRLAELPAVRVNAALATPTVKVAALPAAVLWPNQVMPATSEPYPPALPLPAVSLLGLTAAVGVLIARKRAFKKLLLQYINVLSLSQLQMLRC